ncbi:Sensor protein DivL [Nocardioides dokdonensis FR1436]|uniref:histidine kinase n=1 Tax=Nocardioides dokdonensis FR1436 TaxID=1300347 RepID=A0A1A9GHA0_9ACTN|nr:ATP-binding protein [Nocardioides dokdonensis]ANH37668.1 Sensor protein DivL [Nocardioides dokdonensis FR1436]
MSPRTSGGPEVPREVVMLRELHALLTSISSAGTLSELLQLVAQGVVDVLGFQIAAVNYLDDDGFLEVLAVAGDEEAARTMSGRRVRVEEFLEEFEIADQWGQLRFVPHDRLPDDVVSTWVPRVEALTGPDAWHPMDALHAPLHGPNGELVGVLGVDLPIDGRRPDELARQVLEMYAVQAGLAIHRARALQREHELAAGLRESSRYREQVNAAVTHELKNPLTSILGHVEILQDTPAQSDQVERSVSSISRAARRMEALVESLLSLARVSDPEQLPARRRVDLRELVAEAQELAAVQAQRRDITLTVDGAEEPCHTEGDPAELAMVVSNLLSNALKYTPPGGSVRLTTSTVGDRVSLTCTDTGHGIPLADQATVFDEFTRSAQPDGGEVPGSGLGLAITRRVVERHGGTIDLRSTPGQGTSVQVLLPAA